MISKHIQYGYIFIDLVIISVMVQSELKIDAWRQKLLHFKVYIPFKKTPDSSSLQSTTCPPVVHSRPSVVRSLPATRPYAALWSSARKLRFVLDPWRSWAPTGFGNCSRRQSPHGRQRSRIARHAATTSPKPCWTQLDHNAPSVTEVLAVKKLNRLTGRENRGA